MYKRDIAGHDAIFPAKGRHALTYTDECPSVYLITGPSLLHGIPSRDFIQDLCMLMSCSIDRPGRILWQACADLLLPPVVFRLQSTAQMADDPDQELPVCLLILNQRAGKRPVRQVPVDFEAVFSRHLFHNGPVSPADVLKRPGSLPDIHLPQVRDCLKFQYCVVSHTLKFCTVYQAAEQ